MSKSKEEKKKIYFGKVFRETGRIVAGMGRAMDSKVYLYLVTSVGFKDGKTHMKNETIAEGIGVTSITTVSNSIHRLAAEAVIRLEYKKIGYDEIDNRPITGRIIWVLSPRQRQYCVNLSRSILTPFLSNLRESVSNKEEEDHANWGLHSGEKDLQSCAGDLQIDETDLRGCVSNREGSRESNREGHREETPSKEETQEKDSQGQVDRAEHMAENRLVKGKKITVDCCLFGECGDFGLDESECFDVLSPYCEVRKNRGWCNGKDDCHAAIMSVVRRVNKRRESIKSYPNYLFKALQESLIEDADKMKRPRIRQRIDLDSQSIPLGDVLGDILKNLNSEQKSS